MPNIKSAIKRARTSEGRRLANRAVKSAIRSTRNKLFDAIASGDKAASERLLRDYFSTVDKAAKKGMIKSRAADRRKSRAGLRMKALLNAPQTPAASA